MMINDLCDDILNMITDRVKIQRRYKSNMDNCINDLRISSDDDLIDVYVNEESDWMPPEGRGFIVSHQQVRHLNPPRGSFWRHFDLSLFIATVDYGSNYWEEFDKMEVGNDFYKSLITPFCRDRCMRQIRGAAFLMENKK